MKPVNGAARTGMRRGYWMVDPGSAKQSQDWIYSGEAPGSLSAPRRTLWPVAVPAAATICALTLTGVLALPLLEQGPLSRVLLESRPVLAAPLAAAVLYAAVTVHRALRWAGTTSRHRAVPRSELDVTHTEADEAEIGQPPTRDSRVSMDAALHDDAAGQRQGWEGDVSPDGPVNWPHRPVVVAIADGVSSGVRSAEMARLATRTAWRRTYYHLHALATGVPPSSAIPWLEQPHGWPAEQGDGERLLASALQRAFADANAAVVAAGEECRRLDATETRPAATTLTLVALNGWRYWLVHIGDCSVYHVERRTGSVTPRQVEHNRAAEYARGDPERYAEARRRRMHNVLTRWVGMTPDWTALDPHVLAPAGELAPGDALVLCSDGLDKHVGSASVASAALQLDAERATRRLVRLANDHGGTDHIAVAVLQAHNSERVPTPRVAARWSLWREDAATLFARYRADAAALAFAGVAAAALGSAGALIVLTGALGW